MKYPFSPEQKKAALRDKRLIPANIEKGKNPTNVLEIGRLNGNAKERVGHSTQKPLSLIKIFVKGLSYKGAIVLDFFAGSGTTGRVCIEENRHCIMVDSDDKIFEYFSEHLAKKTENNHKEFKVLKNKNINSIFKAIDSERVVEPEV